MGGFVEPVPDVESEEQQREEDGPGAAGAAQPQREIILLCSLARFTFRPSLIWHAPASAAAALCRLQPSLMQCDDAVHAFRQLEVMGDRKSTRLNSSH